MSFGSSTMLSVPSVGETPSPARYRQTVDICHALLVQRDATLAALWEAIVALGIVPDDTDVLAEWINRAGGLVLWTEEVTQLIRECNHEPRY